MRLLIFLFFMFRVIAPAQQSLDMPAFCADQYDGPKANAPNRPFKVLIGTYFESAPKQLLANWEQEIGCPIEVYEDDLCVRRYVVGEFWNPHHAAPLISYLTQRRISKPDLFIFSFDYKRSDGWGEWTDFGQRIE